MHLLAQKFPYPRAIQKAQLLSTNEDQLIAHSLQKSQYIGIIGLAIALVAAVEFFSRRVEYSYCVRCIPKRYFDLFIFLHIVKS